MLGQGLLRRAVKKHGGSYDDFARQVLGRSRVSIWRWLRGTHAMPSPVIDRLRQYLATPDPEKAK